MKTRVHSYLSLKYGKSLQKRKDKNQAEASNSFSSFWRWSMLVLLSQVCFSFSNLWRYLFYIYLAIFSQILLICLMHCAMIKVCHPNFSWSAKFWTTALTKKRTCDGLFAWRRELLAALFLLHVFLCIAQSQMIFHFSFFTFQISQPAKAMPEFCYFPIGFGNQYEKIKSKGLNVL